MSLTTRERVRALLVGIQQDCISYQELEQVLQRQHSLLATHDVDGLAQHNPAQNRLMAHLHAQAQQRCQHLLALGLKPDEKGMATLIAKLPDELQRQVGAQWQQLEQCLRRCQHQNERNGRLLAGQIETIQTLLGQTPGYGQSHDFRD